MRPITHLTLVPTHLANADRVKYEAFDRNLTASSIFIGQL